MAKDPDIKIFTVVEPGLMMSRRDAKLLSIQVELVSPHKGEALRTGKYIRLDMRVADAMLLLAALKAVQREFDLEEPPPIQTIRVPSAKDRN